MFNILSEKRKKFVAVTAYGLETEGYYGKWAGENDPCPCGSGKKYKNCCIDKQHDS